MPQTPSSCPTRRALSSAGWLSVALVALLISSAGTALALVHFDFEQKYFVHPDRQVWDFSIVRHDSLYHIFYHTIHEQTPNATYGDTIWHSTSPDLKHWNIESPILTVGQGSWDEGALWAPDVFYDPYRSQWALAYTACDSRMNQRISIATSDNLYDWSKAEFNPAVEPDPAQYIWNDEQWWSNFRDPYVWFEEGVFHILVTAKKFLDTQRGVLYHAVGVDLENWFDVGYFFAHDGIDPWRVLESPQFKEIAGRYYLLFGEYDTSGISAIPSDTPGDFTMANRLWIDYGYAPEVDEFDKDIPIFSRIAPFEAPATGLRSYVVRMDTLQVHEDGFIEAYQPHPLAENWKSWTGACNLAQPTFGDNPAMRGDPSVGLVGNGFYGSKEYYQGPLSGRGSPGTILGDAATGTLESDTFRITGTRMTLLVGGGHYPETCYVALVDAVTDTIIYSETGADEEVMTSRQWDLRPYRARTVYLRITDQENGEFGHINVDEIREDNMEISAADQDVPAGTALLEHSAYPNPFNPRTRIRFTLDRELDVSVRIHDLRGRRIWSSGPMRGQAGANSVTWSGTASDGTAAPAATYLYSLVADDEVIGSGKIALVK